MKYIFITFLSISFAFGGESKPLPTEAQQAVDAMELQISKARQECLRKLDKIIGDITKTGNLELAMQVKAKETEIIGQMPKIEGLFVSPVLGKWRGNTGSVREYKADGTCIHDNGSNGKWELRGNKFTTIWDNGNVDTMMLPIKNNVLSGSNNKGISFTITKLPDVK